MADRVTRRVTAARPRVQLDAAGLDALIAILGSARASMKEQVGAEPNIPPTTSEVIVIDPALRSDWPPHPSLQGLMLRHLHFGWVSFPLPHHEAATLGEWLSKNALRQ